MQLSQFDYHLPQRRIAQAPVRPRDHSRLMVLRRSTTRLLHKYFYELPELLRSGDVLVFNNSKVFPARLIGKKQTGGTVEVFLLRPHRGRMWEVLVGGTIRHAHTTISFSGGLRATELQRQSNGVWHARFNRSTDNVFRIAARIGHTPTPPYIKQAAALKDYQTVYAGPVGSVAAPTAGFHFTKQLLARLARMGVQQEFVTLHVGLGTFQPVKTKDITKHHMHPEYVTIEANTARRIAQAKKEGRRIIAVGTTSVRVLETAISMRSPRAYHGWVNTFIYPGYQFTCVDGLVTNFHLPKSTLLMLVSALAGRQRTLDAYRIAIQRTYRFYSFGDAMLIL